MKIQNSYLKDDIIINTDSSLKTNEDCQKEHTQASYGEKEPIPEAHPAQVKKFNAFLGKYQEDINKIVRKYRGSNHLLSHEDIVSETNLSFLKKRDELIFSFGTDFAQEGFRKLAFAFVKNITRWSYSKAAKSSYIKRRQDNFFYTEEGPKTSFEFAVYRTGEEESFYEDFDRHKKCEYLMKMIKEYSGVLSDKEIKVLSMIEKDMTQYEMADHIGVTHQAISIMSLHIFEKIRAYFNIDEVRDNSYDNVAKGHESIKTFFSPLEGYAPMQSGDKVHLKKFLLSNIKAYTSMEVSKFFLQGRYSRQQIVSFVAKNKLGFCLIKKTPPPLREAESNEILKLLKEGKTSQEIASMMKIPMRRVSGKRGSFSRRGLIPKISL